MRTQIKIVIAVMSCLPACVAVAAEDKPLPAEKQSRLLQRLPGADANQDGMLTQAEVRAAVAAKSSGGAEKPLPGILNVLAPTDPVEILRTQPQADTDGDGRLSPTERRAFMASRQAAVLGELLAAHPELDANKDGTLSADEMRSGRRTVEQFVAERILATNPEADQDGDGRLSPEEIRTFQSARLAGQQGSPLAHVDWAIANFRRLDGDGNGQLSGEELESYRRELGGQARGNWGKQRTDRQRPPQAEKGKAKRERPDKSRQAAPNQ